MPAGCIEETNTTQKKVWLLQHKVQYEIYHPINHAVYSKTKNEVLGWLSQFSDLNIIEYLWESFRQAAHISRSKSIFQLDEFCKEEW